MQIETLMKGQVIALSVTDTSGEVVQQDISRGRLVKIVVEDASRSFAMGMSAVYRTDTPPGTAGQWFINSLKEEPDLAGPKQGRHLAATTRKTRAKR